MRSLFANLVLLIVFWVPPVTAHDIGVSQAELVEQDGNRYELSVRAEPAVSSLFTTPLLPEQCEFTGNPRGIQGTGWRTFAFSCVDGLTAADTIELPWRGLESSCCFWPLV